MDRFIITGGTPLTGSVSVGGAKNVVLKALVASLLTDEELVIRNAPDITDVSYMVDVLTSLGVSIQREDHLLRIQNGVIRQFTVPLEVGARSRASSMVMGPMLARWGKATIPNPGGCRIGARPIDRHVEGLRGMGAEISYNSSDGYFHAKADSLHGTTYRFPKNTHTGTETLLLAAVLAKGTTILTNAAEEVEVDDLIKLLVAMGANIARTKPREITIDGVPRLHGATHTIMPDRNEEVTFAIAAAVTHGSITVKNSQREFLGAFLEMFRRAGGSYQAIDEATTRYWQGGVPKATDVVTKPYPGFMTDWQAPWAVFMTQAKGRSMIHETIYESRFSYVSELRKMGAAIEFYDPEIDNPDTFYNFNWSDRVEGYHQGIAITGPTRLHNAVLDIGDLRAGATLVLAALTAHGESYIWGVEHIDRGYEKIEERLADVGANIIRSKE